MESTKHLHPPLAILPHCPWRSLGSLAKADFLRGGKGNGLELETSVPLLLARILLGKVQSLGLSFLIYKTRGSENYTEVDFQSLRHLWGDLGDTERKQGQGKAGISTLPLIYPEQFNLHSSCIRLCITFHWKNRPHC